MAGWEGWTVLVGGIISVIAQWSPSWYGALIGGVLAIIGAIGMMMK